MKEYLPPLVVTALVLLFLFRRQIKRAIQREPLWLKATGRAEMERIVADHKRRKQEK
jgi:hypothetical protein